MGRKLATEPALSEAEKVSARRRIAAQAPLGFAAGLPLYLSGGTLSAWLATENVSLEAIGAFALVALPYNLKFLWAPIMDRFAPPWLDRRRGWIVIMQIALALAVAWLAGVDVVSSPGTLAMVAATIAFLSASQDIVVDAYRTDVLPPDERGRGTGAYVAGYRVALIVAGSGALLVADWLSWRVAILAMAALMVLSMVPTLLAPRVAAVSRPTSLRAAVRDPLAEIAGRRGAGLLLAIVVTYKLGDALAGHMVVPFLLQADFSLSEIGVVQKAMGMAATIVGCGIGGVLVDRIGLRAALIGFGVLQAGANLGYVAIAVAGNDMPTLVVAIAVDNLCNGLGTAAFVALLMSMCHRRFSATQYALLTSLASLPGRLLGAGAGFAAASVGWTGFFALSVAAALPALVLLVHAEEARFGDGHARHAS